MLLSHALLPTLMSAHCCFFIPASVTFHCIFSIMCSLTHHPAPLAPKERIQSLPSKEMETSEPMSFQNIQVSYDQECPGISRETCISYLQYSAVNCQTQTFSMDTGTLPAVSCFCNNTLNVLRNSAKGQSCWQKLSQALLAFQFVLI